MTAQEDLRQIGLNIKRLRKQAKLAQHELGEAIGVSQGQIGNFEAGRRRAKSDQIAQIARVLHCSVLDVYGEAAPERSYLGDGLYLSREVAEDLRQLLDAEKGEDVLREFLSRYASGDVQFRQALKAVLALAAR